MKYFFVLVLSVVWVASAPVTESTQTITEDNFSMGPAVCNSDSINVNGVIVSKSKCTKTATWKLRFNENCTISEYFKETLTSSEPVTFGPLNGIAQCSKTPCGAAEKVVTDCATAFGDKLATIEK